MDEVVRYLLRLIDYNTSCDEGDTDGCCGYIVRKLRENGVNAEKVCPDGAQSMVYAQAPGESEESVMLHAHLDTAPFEWDKKWHFPPDKGSIIRGMVCGRGAIDCKSQAAVWMKLLSDTAAGPKTKLTLRAIFTSDEESGGKNGISRLINERPEFFSGVKLVIGEGGGFPFEFEDKIYYTFQTGEREDGLLSENVDAKADFLESEGNADDDVNQADYDCMERILKKGIDKGYYSPDILRYAGALRAADGYEPSEWLNEGLKDAVTSRGCSVNAGCGRTRKAKRLDITPLYAGMEGYFDKAPASVVFGEYGGIFEEELRKFAPAAALMPTVTPGCSDNRYLRDIGLKVIGFYPFDIKNHILMHCPDEYISFKSLELAYNVMGGIVRRLLTQIII